MSFLTGLLWLGVVVVFIFGFGVGYAARGNDTRGWYESGYQPEPVPQIVAPIPATAERVLPPQPPAVVNVWVAGPQLPQPNPYTRLEPPIDLDALQLPGSAS